MIKDCNGCREELAVATEYVIKGYHLATTLELDNLTLENHFCVFIVDNKGKIIVE